MRPWTVEWDIDLWTYVLRINEEVTILNVDNIQDAESRARLLYDKWVRDNEKTD